jgi:hypothetical protein
MRGLLSASITQIRPKRARIEPAQGTCAISPVSRAICPARDCYSALSCGKIRLKFARRAEYTRLVHAVSQAIGSASRRALSASLNQSNNALKRPKRAQSNQASLAYPKVTFKIAKPLLLRRQTYFRNQTSPSNLMVQPDLLSA